MSLNDTLIQIINPLGSQRDKEMRFMEGMLSGLIIASLGCWVFFNDFYSAGSFKIEQEGEKKAPARSNLCKISSNL